MIRGTILTAGGCTVGLLVAMGIAGGDTDSVTVVTAAAQAGEQPAAGAAGATDCVAPAAGAGPRLDPDQVVNARAVIAAARATGVGDAGARIGIAVALVEGAYTKGERGGPVNGLRNVPYGAGSSVGLFQELAGSGSGYTLTTAQRMDVASAATRFFTKLKKVKGWESMDPGAAGQAVQRSAYPTRYQERMSEAAAIVAANGGSTAGCVTAAPGPAGVPANMAPALAWANSKAGKQYVWGGTGPNSWDCSGLTLRAFEKVGITLPRTAEMQRKWLASGHGTRIQNGQERPGDLMFAGTPAYHVMIVNDPKTKTTIEAKQTCRPNHRGAGIDCGVGRFSYARKANTVQIWRVNQ